MVELLVVATDDARVGRALVRAVLADQPRRDTIVVSDPSSAMSVCSALTVSAVVVDLTMSGGPELLAELVFWHPGVARVAVGTDGTGPASAALPVGTAGCEQRVPPPAVLGAAVRAAVAASRTVGSDAAPAFAAGLPSSPVTWTRLRAMLTDPQVALQDVAALIGHDLTAAGKLLQVVNAVATGRGRTVEDVREAVVALGVESLSDLVLAAELDSLFAPLHDLPAELVRGLRAHGIASAVAARAIATAPGCVGHGFTAGLLQDIGQVVLARDGGSGHRDRVAEACRAGVALHRLERERLGHDHAAVGAALLVMWQLPADVCAAVAGSHTPLSVPVGAGTIDCVAALRIARCLVVTRNPAWADPTEPDGAVELAAELDALVRDPVVAAGVERAVLALDAELGGGVG